MTPDTLTTSTYGGKTDHRAVIGHAPEDRTWEPEQPTYGPIIDPTARIEAFATIDAGIKRATFVGKRSWIFKHAHLGHDAIVGDDVEVSTGAVIGGHAVIGDGAKIGINATILPYRTIGARARVGAGAVVTKDVPDGEVWAGNPARSLKPVPVVQPDATCLIEKGCRGADPNCPGCGCPA